MVESEEVSVLNAIVIHAATKGKVEAMQMALGNGGNIEVRTSAMKVQVLDEWHTADAEEELIETEEDADGRERLRLQPCLKGPTPLMRAAGAGHLQVVKLLLERLALPNARDEHGQTALHLAAAGSHFKTSLALLRAGATRWVMDANGRDPFACLPSGVLATAGAEKQRWQQLLRPGGEWCETLMNPGAEEQEETAEILHWSFQAV